MCRSEGHLRWSRVAWGVLLLAGLCTYVQAQLDLNIGPPMPPLVVEMVSSAFAVVADCPEDFEFEGFEYACAQFDSIWDSNAMRSFIDAGLEMPFIRDVVPALRDGNTAELMKSRPVVIQPWTEQESGVIKGVRAGNMEIWVMVFEGSYKGRGLLLFLWREEGQ